MKPQDSRCSRLTLHGSYRERNGAVRRAAMLPLFVRDLLASPPRRGQGLNLWFYRAARLLHPYRTPLEIIELLKAVTSGEPIRHGEIERAVGRSATTAW